MAVIAPLLFSIYLEFHIGLFACCALSLFAIAQDRQALSTARHRRPIMGIASLALLVMVAYLSKQVYYATSTQTLVNRNFYGVLRIQEFDVNDPQLARRVLRHGAIDHGMQFVAREKRRLATT